MKTKAFTILFYILFIYNCFPEEQLQSTDPLLSTYTKGTGDGHSWRERAIHYEVSNTTFNKDNAISTIWVIDPEINIYILLLFYKDDVFKIGTSSAGVLITGKYKITNNTLELYPLNVDNYINKYIDLSEEKVTGVFNTDTDNVFFANSLVINDIPFYPIGSEKVNGQKAIVVGTTVVVDKDRKVVNDKVRFRSKPNTSSKTINIIQYAEMNGITIGTLQKGTIVYTLAKSDYMEEYDNIKAPWYYVQILHDEGYQLGWVFGGYFSNYNENENASYWQILRSELRKLK